MVVLGGCKMGPARVVLLFIRGVFLDRAELAVENLALRQQLAILTEKTKRPKLRPRGRRIANERYSGTVH